MIARAGQTLIDGEIPALATRSANVRYEVDLLLESAALMI